VKRSLGAAALLLALTTAACAGGDESSAPANDQPAPGSTGTAVDTTTATVPEDTFVGADGVTSTITDTSRIVTLSGDLTEILFELGVGDSVVGVDLTTVYPEAATQLPIVGVGRFLTAEGVLAQQPTLVIGDTQTDPVSAIEQIRGAGVPVIILEAPTSFEGLTSKIHTLGDLLGVADAATALSGRIETEVAEAVSVLGDTPPRRMAYVYTRGPDVMLLFGDGMVTNPLIEAAAGVDVGKESGVEGTIPATAEAIIAARPEVILVPEEGFGILGGLEAFMDIPGIAQTPAGQNGEIYAYPEGDFLTFGPRVAESLRRLIADAHGLP
jgi:iron complex transport system substrate-binding protein